MSGADNTIKDQTLKEHEFLYTNGILFPGKPEVFVGVNCLERYLVFTNRLVVCQDKYFQSLFKFD